MMGEYVPRAKICKTEKEEEVVDFDLQDGEFDFERIRQISAKNKELRGKYFEHYQSYRERLLAEIQPDVDAYCNKMKKEYDDKLEQLYKNKFEEAEKELVEEYEDEFEDELEHAIKKEMLYAKRRKEVNCNREYQKIKKEIIEAKKRGDKLCLRCSATDVQLSCICQQAFYCNEECRKEHSWIHVKYCQSNAADQN